MLKKLDIVLSIIGGVAILGTIGLGIVVLWINSPEKFDRAFWARRVGNLLGLAIGICIVKAEDRLANWCIHTDHTWVLGAVNAVLIGSVVYLIYAACKRDKL